MADRTPQVAPVLPGETEAYRPLSGLAIAGLTFGLIYAALVVVSTAMALFQGAPFFLAAWMFLLPILGAALSGIALWQIGNSEGTRAGAKAARWGIGLSLVFGLGYMAYSTATALAVKEQANRFLTTAGEDAGFFPLLVKGDVNAAFLLTQTFARRGGSNPGDDEAMRRQFDAPLGPDGGGWLSRFAESNVVRMFQQARMQNAPVHVEPLGVRGWSYESKGYKVARSYRISTPEVAFNLVVVTQSTESDRAGAGRKWFVVWTESGLVAIDEVTPSGQRMHELRQKSRAFLDAWLAKLERGRRLEAFLDTVEPRKRLLPERHVTGCVAAAWWAFPWVSTAATAGPALVAPPFVGQSDGELERFLYLPGYDRFLREGALLKTDDLRGLSPEARRQARADLERLIREGMGARLPLLFRLEDANYALWNTTSGGRLQIAHRFQLPLGLEGKEAQGVIGKGQIVVESSFPSDDPRTVDFTPEWRVAAVELDRIVVPASSRGRP
jgi:hypothetical protein